VLMSPPMLVRRPTTTTLCLKHSGARSNPQQCQCQCHRTVLASSRSWPRASTPNVKPPKPPGTTILMKKASQRFTALHQRPHTVTHEHNHCAMNDETALSALETRAHAHVHAHTHTQHAHTNSIQALHLSQKLGWSMTASVQLVIVNKPHDHKFYCTRRLGHVSCFLCTNLSTNSHTLIPSSSRDTFQRVLELAHQTDSNC
jgi:hypothetical protein